MNPGPDRWTELAGRFDLGPVLGTAEFVARGAMGEVWRLETIRGAWAVKWQFPGGPVQPRPADVGVQVAAAAAGIPLPAPVLTPAGEAVARIGSHLVRVYEWAELARPAEPPVGDRTAAEAGRLLGVLHSLALPATEPDDPWFSEVRPLTDWAALAERAAAAGTAWAGRLASSQERIAGLSASAGTPRRPGPRIVCHRDLCWAFNLSGHPRGDRARGRAERHAGGRRAAPGQSRAGVR